MSVKTIKVSNVSLGASERDIKEFFSFSGDIEYLEMQSESERSQIAYVTFKDAQGAETAMLLSGATIVDLSVNITLCPEYELPPEATALPPAPGAKAPESAFRKAEDVVSGILAKGVLLGKEAVNSAKAFDEKHQLSSTASIKVATFEKKVGLTEKISAGTSLVSSKVREVDQKFQVSEKTKSAFAVAEEKVSNAGSAIMNNRIVVSGTSWVADTFSKVAKAAGEVGQKTKEKVVVSEEEQRKKTVEDFAKVHLSESPKAASAPPEPQQRPKPEPAQEMLVDHFYKHWCRCLSIRSLKGSPVEVGRNLGNWIPRFLDRYKPSAQIRIDHEHTKANSQLLCLESCQIPKNPKSSTNILSRQCPTIPMMMESSKPTTTTTQHRIFGIITPDASGLKYVRGSHGVVVREDIRQWMLRK